MMTNHWVHPNLVLRNPWRGFPILFSQLNMCSYNCFFFFVKKKIEKNMRFDQIMANIKWGINDWWALTQFS